MAILYKKGLLLLRKWQQQQPGKVKGQFEKVQQAASVKNFGGSKARTFCYFRKKGTFTGSNSSQNVYSYFIAQLTTRLQQPQRPPYPIYFAGTPVLYSSVQCGIYGL